MFEKWLLENDLSSIQLDQPLFPPASDRVFWSACLDPQEIKNAEEYLNYNWPMIRASQFMAFHRQGDRLAQEKPYFERRKVLLRLMLGELAEYKGRFLQDLCDGVFLVCEETFWGLSAHFRSIHAGELLPSGEKQYIDLFAAETAELLVVFRHLFARELEDYCPDLLDRLDYELDRRIIKPYLAHTDFLWMGYGRRVNNWNPWILSNVLTVFLLLVKDRAMLETGIAKMFTELDHYYLQIPDDGGCDEGPHYWDVAGGRLFAFCDRLYVLSGGRINFFTDEKLKRIMLYPVHAHISGCRFANFADGSSRIMDNNDYILYVNGLRTGLDRLCALADTLKKAQASGNPIWMRRVGSFCAELYGRIYAERIESDPAQIVDDFTVLPDTQVAYLRRGSWYCAAKGGFNGESHNHNDVGSFMAYHKGEPVLIDPGCGVYRKETFTPALRYTIWTMQSAWHNLPLVNGQMQKPGKEFRADAFGGEDGTVQISFAGVYGEEAGLRELRRRIDLTAEGLTLADTFTLDREENTVCEHFMTTLKPEVRENAVTLGEDFLLFSTTPCTVEIDEMPIADDPKLYTDWAVDVLYRVRFCFPCGKTLATKFVLKER